MSLRAKQSVDANTSASRREAASRTRVRLVGAAQGSEVIAKIIYYVFQC
ncbi:MAG: hypothetical protein PUP90_19300 [Nostoc sp. S4]|nr:hypothetical protein [Nostoc sp. S4]